MMLRICPLCGTTTTRTDCCGIDLTVSPRRFRMSPYLVKLVHTIAARKGLDDETYRMRLQAVGVDTCKALDLDRFKRFMVGLNTLPDCPRWLASQAARRASPTMPAVPNSGVSDANSKRRTLERRVSTRNPGAVRITGRRHAGNNDAGQGDHLGAPADGGIGGKAAGVLHAGRIGGHSE